jgi:plastocyanin
MHKAILLVLAAAVALVLASTAFSSAAKTKTVSGTVGPGFTISAKGTKGLKAGKVKFKISDQSNIHNFHVSGPGVNKDLTSVGFVGTKTVTLKLKKGTYQYFCVPHESTMHGSFKVK